MALEYINLWTLLVNGVVGSFWITILLCALMLWLIMNIFGKMSTVSCIYYELLFLMAMSMGASNIVTFLIFCILGFWFYNAYKNWSVAG